jgi:hypothetical protein
MTSSFRPSDLAGGANQQSPLLQLTDAPFTWEYGISPNEALDFPMCPHPVRSFDWAVSAETQASE